MAKYPFCKAIKKYGDLIIVTTLLIGEDQYCLDIENRLRPTEGIGWNVAVGGLAPMLGRKHSPEALMRMSRSQKGRPISEEQRVKMRAIPRTPEWIANMVKSRKESTYTPSLETRQKKAASQRGRKLSEEAKEKIRQKALGHKRNVGRPISDRAKELIRRKATGRNHSEATKQKLRMDRVGIPVPEHVREKMRKAKSVVMECPHCHKIGKAGGMQSRHFDHCKFKDTSPKQPV